MCCLVPQTSAVQLCHSIGTKAQAQPWQPARSAGHQTSVNNPLPLTGSSTAITSVRREPSALAAMLLMTVAFVKCRRSCKGRRQ